ncbi:MAG: hypothetical protein Rubg2KO_18560 [Rubricoccaceae bacterium]
MSGQFLFSNPKKDLVIFPPSDLNPNSANAAYELRNVNGELVAEHTVRSMNHTRSDAFLSVNTFSAARWEGVLEDGQSYTLRLVVNGEAFSSLPFSVVVSEGDDPFDPKTLWILDGPWRTHAYFEHETARPDYQLFFHAWIGPDEVTASAPVEVSIQRAGEEVAWASTHVAPDGGWQNVNYRLQTSASREERSSNPVNWTMADVTPGVYEIVFSSEGQAFRTMTIEAGNGAFVASPRSDMAAERSTFLTPRSLRADDSQTPMSLYWIVSE